MSGHPTYTDDQQPGRRKFLKQVLGLAALPLVVHELAACNSTGAASHITGGMVGANHSTGHMLRPGHTFPVPAKTISTAVLIAGGGISGLSAKRWLEQHGQTDVMLVELSDQVGGNSISGTNNSSAYPWGAHYLPLPDHNRSELVEFLQSANVITGFNAEGLPVYNEYHLCHDPEERLYINGLWQEGLVPQFGIKSEDKQQIAAFFKAVEGWRAAKGNDGKYAFDIPVDTSSADEQYRQLDSLSFARYLAQQGYTSEYLLWYLEYCCKDDYGSGLAHTSAWAGIHYFASRRGKAANAHSSAVLTWPQGNAYLMDNLRKQAPGNSHVNMLVYKTELTTTGVDVYCYDVTHKESVLIHAGKLLLSTPQYINKHILPPALQRAELYPMLSYAPWVVANVTVTHIPTTKGYPLCWDNVIYGQESVGYVLANHQQLGHQQNGVITWYLPITDSDPVAARNAAHKATYEQWRDKAVAELKYAHPGIERYITHIDVWVWGHGMIRPQPGYIWSQERQAAMQPIDNKVFFAHTDLSGMSIFEEAFYQGIRAAKQILQQA